jgi:hypothetical protein
MKKDGAWRLTEPVDAKADENAVTTAITKLTELEVASVAATLAKSHEKLEVDEKNAAHVVAKGGGKVLIDAFIGAYKSGSTMLRLEGQDTVAAVRGSIRFAFAKDTKDWRDRKITDIPTEQVQKITFINTGGTLSFQREGDGFTQVLGKGEKKIEPFDANKAKGVVGTAANLSATDFAKPDETPEQLGFTPSGPSVVLSLKSDAGESEVVYRIGNKVENTSYYVRKDGDDITYLVSAWIGERLLATRDTFVKKEPTGAPDDPIQVQPTGMQGLPPGVKLPPGFKMPPGAQFVPPPEGHP